MAADLETLKRLLLLAVERVPERSRCRRRCRSSSCLCSFLPHPSLVRIPSREADPLLLLQHSLCKPAGRRRQGGELQSSSLVLCLSKSDVYQQPHRRRMRMRWESRMGNRPRLLELGPPVCRHSSWWVDLYLSHPSRTETSSRSATALSSSIRISSSRTSIWTT